MKRFILFFFCIFSLTSCVTTTPSINWSINGDVTAYNADGSVLRQWDNVVIESGYTDATIGTQTTSNAIKSFGINFTDPKTHKNIIISNAVPCIIEYTNKKYENYLPKNSSLEEFFKSGEIFSAEKDRKVFLENSFISEIKSDIRTAQSAQDINAVKNKIEILNEYHQKMGKKGSYFNISDDLGDIKFLINKQAKKLGINL